MNKKRILIADDDQSILEVMQLILEDEGYEVATSVDGEDVYKMNGDFPDVLLLDIRMSGIDGRDICKYLKSHNLKKDIPVIIISANKDTEQIARNVGADDFLTKPFEIDDLIGKVKKYTDRNYTKLRLHKA